MAALVQSVERALLLLQQIADSSVPATTPELAQLTGVNRGTAWRLLRTLEHFDLIDRNPETGCYSIGFGALRLTAASNASSLVLQARPVLESLAELTDGNVFLEVASDGKLIVLDEARAANPVQVDLAGLDIPMHCGSVGKLFLASLPQVKLDEFLDEPLAELTPHTITDPIVLRAQIDECRRSGVAINYREHQDEWCAITAVVRDRTGRHVAYINATLPTYRWTELQLLGLTEPLREATLQIEKRLGYRPAL